MNKSVQGLGEKLASVWCAASPQACGVRCCLLTTQLARVTFSSNMGDQYYVDEYDEEPDMDELKDYMSPDEGDGDLAGFERPELNVDLSTAVVVSNLPQVRLFSCT